MKKVFSLLGKVAGCFVGGVVYIFIGVVAVVVHVIEWHCRRRNLASSKRKAA